MKQLFRPAIWETQPPGDAMTALMAGSMALSALGGMSSAQASIKQGQQASQFANYNADIMSQRATLAEAEGFARADISARAGGRALGRAGAAFGASGVVVGTGSALDVMADQATEVELQRQLEIYQGEAQATALRNQANLVRAQGYAASDAGYAQGTNTLLSTGANLAFMGYKAGFFSGGGTVPSPAAGAMPHGTVAY